MGNITNEENWAAQERLRAIERAAWWRGWVGRGDLVSVFGISAAQASGDLQKYQELNPGALVYQMSRKRYEGTEGMQCVLHAPRLEEGMSIFLGGPVVGMPGMNSFGDLDSSGAVDVVRPPQRKVKLGVERKVFSAACSEAKVRVRYFSVRSGTARWRWIAPRAFGHDGMRWHARAWCLENRDWRDFVLGRIASAEWPVEMGEREELSKDAAWEKRVTLTLTINPDLDEAQRTALAMDYGVGKGGMLTVRCREAMRQYVEAMLRVPGEDGLPAHFV